MSPAAIAVAVVGALIGFVLAAPLPVRIARRRAAARGITLGDAGTWRAARRIDVLLLDSVGTITTGDLKVVSVDPVDPSHDRNLRWFAGALEHESAHRIGKAIARLSMRGRLTGVHIHDGLGISGSVDRHPVRVGHPDWIGLPHPSGAGRTVAVEVDQRPLGHITVAEAMRDDAADSVRRARGLSVEPLLASSDNSVDTERLAEESGITQAWPDAAAEKRGLLVTELREQGKVVATLGADAAHHEAHALADLSLGASDAVSADVRLADLDLGRAVDAIALSRRVPGLILRNRIAAGVALVAGLSAALVGLPLAGVAAIALAGVLAVVLLSALP